MHSSTTTATTREGGPMLDGLWNEASAWGEVWLSLAAHAAIATYVTGVGLALDLAVVAWPAATVAAGTAALADLIAILGLGVLLRRTDRPADAIGEARRHLGRTADEGGP